MADLGEKCAVFGVYGTGLEAARLTFFGLFALQHRGQESAGIATSEGERVHIHRKMGLVPQVFSERDIQKLPGYMAIGHTRYSTSKGSSIKHAQPTFAQKSGITLSHNGNLPSTTALERFLSSRHVEHKRMSDSEMITEAISVFVEEGMSLEDAVAKTYPMMTGAFSILVMDKSTMIAIRDAYGVRPFSMGTINSGYVFSSETCAFHPIGAAYLRDVEPGEMVVVNEKGMHSVTLALGQQKLDIFEFVYFARPDSILLGKSVYDVRRNSGIELAKEFKADADVIVPVPDSAIPAALGMSAATGIPLEMGLVKNRYIHRTFIQPEQHIREQGVKIKLTPLPSVLKGKRVTIVDDSIVRGTTSKQMIAMVFEAGAKEVNLVLASPPVRFPDFYGIDTPTQEHLIAARKSVEEIREYIGATRLHYLSYKGLIRATGLPEELFSTSCFTGKYPIDLKERSKEVQSLLTNPLFAKS